MKLNIIVKEVLKNLSNQKRKEEEQDIKKNIDKNLDINLPNPIYTNYKSIIKNKWKCSIKRRIWNISINKLL